MLTRPVFTQSSNGDLQRFWISDYPLLCYLQYNNQGQLKSLHNQMFLPKPSQLVMTHIGDPEQPTKTFYLTEEEQFVQFVD